MKKNHWEGGGSEIVGVPPPHVFLNGIALRRRTDNSQIIQGSSHHTKGNLLDRLTELDCWLTVYYVLTSLYVAVYSLNSAKSSYMMSYALTALAIPCVYK